MEGGQTPFDYPTLIIGLEFKEPLPEGGGEWLFLRARARVIKGGRMDIEVTISEKQGRVIVLGQCLALFVTRHIIEGRQEGLRRMESQL